MKRIIKKSLVFITLLTLIMLSSLFILPSMLFADTYTFPGIGDENWQESVSWPDATTFHFDVTGVDLNDITSATLKIWSNDCDYLGGEIDEAYLGVHFLGHLVDITQSELSEFSLDPSWITLGQNDAYVEQDVTNGGWSNYIYDAELVLETGKSGGGNEAVEPEIWVRNHEMQCWQVWINQDNAFEFVFVWEYYNNNHVQIFDMAGNLVFETNMEKGEAHFVAALPDGMYTVKTFHEYGHILQEFVIGKP